MQCKNCKEELTGKQQFCSNCGQKNIAKLNLKYILGQFVEDLFNWDSKFFTTIKKLALKPGFLSKEYVDGRRVSYVPPIRIYIVLSVVFFFFVSTVDFKDSNQSNFNLTIGAEEGEEVEQIDGVVFPGDTSNYVVTTEELKKMDYEGVLNHYLDSVGKDKGFAGYVSRKMALAKVHDESFTGILIDQFSLFLLLMLPLFSLMYATIFSRNKRGFIGHLIFNIHLNSFIIISLLFFMLIDLPFEGDGIIDYILFFAVALYGQYYMIKSIMVFYQRKLWVALYKYVLLIFGYLIMDLLFIIFVFSSSIMMV